jgi:hypothetical protein
MKNIIFDCLTICQKIGIFIAIYHNVIFQVYVCLNNINIIIEVINHQINIIQSLIIKFEIFITNCVRAGNSVQVSIKLAVIFGIIKTIIKVTIDIVNTKRIIGYIKAHFTFHFNSIFSSILFSVSSNIFHKLHVFSQTETNDINKLSNTLGYWIILSLIQIQ